MHIELYSSPKVLRDIKPLMQQRMLLLFKHKTYLRAHSLYRHLNRNGNVNSVSNEPLLWSRDANVSDSYILGSPRAPSFLVSSNSNFGNQRFDSHSFGQPAVSMPGSKDQSCKPGKESTTPLLKISGFGKSAFGIN